MIAMTTLYYSIQAKIETVPDVDDAEANNLEN